MEHEDIQELLMLTSQQSLKISEQQNQIQQLTTDLQKKESMLTEALQTAESLKKNTVDVQSLQNENAGLKQLITESDYRIKQIRRDYQKEIMLLKKSDSTEHKEKSPSQTDNKRNHQFSLLGPIVIITVIQTFFIILTITVLFFAIL